MFKMIPHGYSLCHKYVRFDNYQAGYFYYIVLSCPKEMWQTLHKEKISRERRTTETARKGGDKSQILRVGKVVDSQLAPHTNHNSPRLFVHARFQRAPGDLRPPSSDSFSSYNTTAIEVDGNDIQI